MITLLRIALILILTGTLHPLAGMTVGSCKSSISCSDRFISDDCGNGCSGTGDCSTDCTQVSTFFRPRPILTDLTYRNNISFYQRYHDACCSFFSYDVTYAYQKNRKAACIGAGFFGKNPVTVAQYNGNIESINLSLGSSQPDGFLSTFTFRPKRSVFAWMPSLHFNLDCFCTGLWSDITFAVLSVKHEFCINEKITTPGEISGIITVQQAFDRLKVFSDSRTHAGVDDIEVRLGYDYLYCDNDHVGGYLSGIIPTGKNFDNTRFWQPLVGSRNGAFGFGITADNTVWDDEVAQTAFVIMTELKYLYRFRHKEPRIFDFTNGPLSRFLLVAESDNRFDPISGTNLLRRCVDVEPRSLLEWWLGFHYQRCAWGFEAAYNLFFRDRERIQSCAFDFDNFGIFDMTRCNNLTSHSTAKIFDNFGEGVPDETFVNLTPTDVNLNSAKADKALSSTISASVSYNNIWRGCYPWSAGLSVSYEFAGRKHRHSTLENWGVFGKWTMSI